MLFWWENPSRILSYCWACIVPHLHCMFWPELPCQQSDAYMVTISAIGRQVCISMVFFVSYNSNSACLLERDLQMRGETAFKLEDSIFPNLYSVKCLTVGGSIWMETSFRFHFLLSDNCLEDTYCQLLVFLLLQMLFDDKFRYASQLKTERSYNH